jgi:hypothetical protein
MTATTTYLITFTIRVEFGQFSNSSQRFFVMDPLLYGYIPQNSHPESLSGLFQV